MGPFPFVIGFALDDNQTRIWAEKTLTQEEINDTGGHFQRALACSMRTKRLAQTVMPIWDDELCKALNLWVFCVVPSFDGTAPNIPSPRRPLVYLQKQVDDDPAFKDLPFRCIPWPESYAEPDWLHKRMYMIIDYKLKQREQQAEELSKSESTRPGASATTASC